MDMLFDLACPRALMIAGCEEAVLDGFIVKGVGECLGGIYIEGEEEWEL